MTQSKSFSKLVIQWQKQHGRHDLPWQNTDDAYLIWVSEVMLQQTQVTTVIPYYQKFIQSFATVMDLALAEEDTVLAHWSGLGYYRRARNLHACAKQVVENHAGQFPQDVTELESLPGIGRSTAGAIASLAYKQPTSILDGNVKRILCRFFGVQTWSGDGKTQKLLWQHADSVTPLKHTHIFNQGMMDLGSMICTRSKPKCQQCPLIKNCFAYQNEMTGQLPVPKPKKKIAKEELTMLVIKKPDGSLLLQKRDNFGIWPGLWSWPICPEDEKPQSHLKQQFGLKLKKSYELKAFKHQLTHKTLQITAMLCEVEQAHSQVKESSSIIWAQASACQQQALATPVQKILKHLIEEAVCQE